MFLFTCFRIRYFVLSYIYAKKRDKGPLNYSHIEIIRKNRFIFLGIFVYDTSFDVLYNSFKLSLRNFVTSDFSSY